MSANRVSVVRFASFDEQMLRYSTTSLEAGAGTDQYDGILVMMRPTEQVLDAATRMPKWDVHLYQPDMALDYVPTLRAMFNYGFALGFGRNDWVVIADLDMYFGRNWLANLIREAEPDVIPNATHITPIRGRHVVTANLGLPKPDSFDERRFWSMHENLNINGKVETEKDRGGWEACATLPYVLHRSQWERHGPWALHAPRRGFPPDREFFHRCHDGGARFVLCRDSICYHHEGGERKSGKRPIGMEHTEEGR